MLLVTGSLLIIGNVDQYNSTKLNVTYMVTEQYIVYTADAPDSCYLLRNDGRGYDETIE